MKKSDQTNGAMRANTILGDLLVDRIKSGRFDEAKSIIDLGYEANRQSETIAVEMFLFSQLFTNQCCIDFYIRNGVEITSELLERILEMLSIFPNEFDTNKSIELVDMLRKWQTIS